MFINALMLVGIAGAALPLVLHLLSRARYADVEWAAMMFLAPADTHQRHSAKLSQILLLLIRMAMVSALAVALARPVIQGYWAGTSEGRVTAALLLDCSAATSFDENGRTRFELAQSAAKQVLRGLRPGDRVSLILMGREQSDADVEPTGDLQSVAARIDEARPSASRAGVARALNRAADVLERFEKSHRDVFIICDRRARNWDGIDEHFASAWRQRVAGPGISARAFIIPVGNADADNVAVEQIRLANPPAIRGQSIDVEVRLHNYGAARRAALLLTLRAGNRKIVEKRVNLAPEQEVSLVVTVPHDIPAFTAAGSQIISADVGSSGYRLDDRLDSVIEVIDPIRVLVVSGDQRPGALQGDGDFVRLALAPHAAAGDKGIPDPCVVTALPAENWGAGALDGYQVVVLANIERFSASQARALERYVFAGGRVLVAPASLSRVEDYNAALYKNGAGILPAWLEPPTAADGSEATSLLGIDLNHPIFQFLRGQPDPIPSATIARYVPATPRQVDAAVLAWYASGAPFLIEGRSERGRVLLLTTSLDADWTTLPLTNFYLPFVQSAVRYLAGGSVRDCNLEPGQAIHVSFDDTVRDRRVTLVRPDHRVEPLEILRLGKQSEVRSSDTDAPGAYRVQVEEPGKPPASIFFAVHPPREESDLTQMTEKRWQSLAENLNVKRIDPNDRPISSVMASGREGHELWSAGLAVVMLLGVLELVVARAAQGQLR